MNKADTEIIAAQLKGSHEVFFEEENGMDLVILNTCGVKLPTEQRVIEKIKSLTARGVPLIISGCLPHINLRAVRDAAPHSVILGVNGPLDITWAIDQAMRKTGSMKIYIPSTTSKLEMCRARDNPYILIIPIAEGCLGNCAYCGTKLARGQLKSLTPEKIMKILEDGIKDGAYEIWLTSQDNGAYGKDIGVTLVDVISRISAIEGDFRVRIGMMNPGDAIRMLDKLIEIIKGDPRFYRFFHLPVQSGSESVLRKMRRMHDVASFEQCASELKKELNASIATDIIVGFPGETEEDFEKSIEMIKRTRPDIVNISKYGPRRGTEAAKMQPLPSQVVKSRAVRMYMLVREIMLSRNREWLGWSGIVKIIERKKTPIGRTPTYKPVAIRENVPMGSTLEVQISNYTEASLVGKVIKIIETDSRFRNIPDHPIYLE